MSAGDRERWDARHAEGALDRAPADWLALHDELVAARAPGRALDVACGLGRNAVHLAGLGFSVDALDVSPVAVARLGALARERRLSIAPAVADLRAHPGLPAGGYDVVVCTFFLERALLAPMAAALAPDGLLVVETFTTAQAGRARGPSEPRMLLRPGELRAAFGGLELLDWREQDDGDMAVAGVVARRPGG